MRFASKKTGGSTRNPKGHARPKHRGWRVQDTHVVSEGTILATQLKTRFHPGLNVRASVFKLYNLLPYSLQFVRLVLEEMEHYLH